MLNMNERVALSLAIAFVVASFVTFVAVFALPYADAASNEFDNTTIAP